MTYIQNIAPAGGHLLLSAAFALVPILYFFWALAVKRMKGYLAGLSTLLIGALLAVLLYRMPVVPALMSAVHGASYGLIPIVWVIVPSVFLYKLSVKTGYFETIRDSIVSITEDRRLQALLVAFSFGSFLEGAAGFGAPVAICASLLVGLGFSPLLAAGICLVANTPPVAFGAIGIPVLAMEGPTGVSALDISRMLGRQLPLLALVIPFYFIVLMAGWKKAVEVLPAVLVSGLSFACAQFLVTNYLGPELPDIAAALVSLIALTVFLRFWKPRTVFRFDGGAGSIAPEAGRTVGIRGPAPAPGLAGGAVRAVGPRTEDSVPVSYGENEFPIELADLPKGDPGPYGAPLPGRRDTEFAAESALPGGSSLSRPALTAGAILRAWSPFLVLTFMISIWGIPAVKQALTGHYAGSSGLLSGLNRVGHALTFHPSVPWLNHVVVGENGKALAAEFKLELLGAAGTAILAAAFITKFIYRISFRLWWATLVETAVEMRFSIITILSVLGFAYIANNSGISATLGHALALTGVLFPLFSPLIGWLGVFITGSDTSANVLFCNLQKVTADRVGMPPVLALAANTSGGGTAKMISPQSIAIASAAVGLNGRESELLRFTFKHSVLLLVVIALLTYLQSGPLSWMVP